MNNLLSYLNQHPEETFRDILFSYIDKSGHSDSEIYKKVDIDRKLFSKIRCSKDYIPRKGIIIKLCLALHLRKQDFQKLLNSAGYSLSTCNVDLIINYCIENDIYDLRIINDYLYEYCNTVL